MASLIEALMKSRFAGMDATAAAAELAKDGDPIVDSTLYTVAKLVKVVGESSATLVMGTLQQVAAQNPLVESFRIKLCSSGQDWSDPDWQSKIDSLGAANLGNWGAPLIAQLKEIGIKPQKVWENVGLISLPTSDEIAAALNQIAGAADREAFQTAFQFALAQMDAGAFNLAQAKTFMGQ